jgi:DNA-binding transcriptional LysR family regulator
MDIRHLRHFVAAVDHGNMLRASESIHITQPALTKSIKTLEDDLQIKLFNRHPKGVEATIFGRQLYEHAMLIINQLDRAEKEIRAGVKGEIGHIRIGFGWNFAGDMLVNALFDVLKLHPNITISVVSKPFEEISKMLRHGDLDLAVAIFPLDQSDAELKYETLVVDEFRTICRREHPLADQPMQTLEQLAEQDWILCDGPELVVRLFRAMFLDEDLPVPKPVVQTNSIFILKSALHREDYLSLVPPSIVHEELESGAFKIVPSELPQKQTKAGIIYRANDVLPIAVSELIGALQNNRDKLKLDKNLAPVGFERPENLG